MKKLGVVFIIAVLFSMAFVLADNDVKVVSKYTENEIKNITKTITKECEVEDNKINCNKFIEIEIEKKDKNKTKLTSKNIYIEFEGEIESRDNKTFFKWENMTKEIKIMPDTASEIAIERLRLKVCNEENNCTIQLKQVGTNGTLKYEVKAMKEKRFLFWKWKTEVKTEIDAETGN